MEDIRRVVDEQVHADLKGLNEALGVSYFYIEWRQAMGIVKPTG